MFITNDIKYIGVNDHNIDLFEGQYVVPNGMAYNSYAIVDEKVAIMDTVDQHFGDEWLNNIKAVLQVMKFIYDNIMYAELNTKSDYCQVCGYDGEISIVEEDGKLVWECPNCGNRDQDKMNVARRTCGYIGTQYWNQGRTQEIRDRVLHL